MVSRDKRQGMLSAIHGSEASLLPLYHARGTPRFPRAGPVL